MDPTKTQIESRLESRLAELKASRDKWLKTLSEANKQILGHNAAIQELETLLLKPSMGGELNQTKEQPE